MDFSDWNEMDDKHLLVFAKHSCSLRSLILPQGSESKAAVKIVKAFRKTLQVFVCDKCDEKVLEQLAKCNALREIRLRLTYTWTMSSLLTVLANNAATLETIVLDCMQSAMDGREKTEIVAAMATCPNVRKLVVDVQDCFAAAQLLFEHCQHMDHLLLNAFHSRVTTVKDNGHWLCDVDFMRNRVRRNFKGLLSCVRELPLPIRRLDYADTDLQLTLEELEW